MHRTQAHTSATEEGYEQRLTILPKIGSDTLKKMIHGLISQTYPKRVRQHKPSTQRK